MEKKILYIDMDGVLVNFNQTVLDWYERFPHLKERYKLFPDHIHGIFRDAKPIDGSINSVHELVKSGKYEIFIASAAPWGNPESSTDKRYWIEREFPHIFHKRIILTHRKDLLIGDYLIDDSLGNGAKDFKGTLLRFGVDYKTGLINEYPTWDDILNKLL